MPSKNYKYRDEKNEEHNIKIEWKLFFKDCRIDFDGHTLLRFENQKQFMYGASTEYSGDKFDIKLEKSILGPEIIIQKNNMPLEGSTLDPKYSVKTAQGILIILAALNLLMGLLAVTMNNDQLLQFGYGWYNIILFFLYTCSLFVSKKLNLLAGIGAGTTLFIADTIMALIQLIHFNVTPGGAIIVRLILGIPLIKGVFSAKKLQGELLGHFHLK